MKRLVKFVVAAGALTVLLALPSGAQARTLWVCQVPGEPEPVVFVSAANRAIDGISRANERAGATFSRKFGEECHVETG
jgi:hypothetical protein